MTRGRPGSRTCLLLQEVKTEDEEGRRIVFAWLQRRFHGQWNDAGDAVTDPAHREPHRSQRYLKTGARTGWHVGVPVACH